MRNKRIFSFQSYLFTGGLEYALEVNPIATSILQVVVCVAFTVVCLKASQTTQLMVSLDA